MVFDILEHEFNSLNDPLSIIPLNLTVKELLHIVVFLASESQLLCLIPCAFMLYDSETPHHINWTPLIDIQTVFFIIAANQVKDPGEHWQVFDFVEDRHEIFPFYREPGVEFRLGIKTMHHLFILIDESFYIALHMVPRNVFRIYSTAWGKRGHFDELKTQLGYLFSGTMLKDCKTSYQILYWLNIRRY